MKATVQVHCAVFMSNLDCFYGSSVPQRLSYLEIYTLIEGVDNHYIFLLLTHLGDKVSDVTMTSLAMSFYITDEC